MRSRQGRVVVLVVAVAAAVALFFVLRDEGGDGGEAPTPVAGQPGADESPGGGARDGRETEPRPPRPSVPTVEIVGGEPKGGPLDLSVESGEEVRFRIESDTPGEVHVHGYEVFKEVEAGKTAGIGFPAEIEGAFEIEMHRFTDDGHIEIASLEVTPS